MTSLTSSTLRPPPISLAVFLASLSAFSLSTPLTAIRGSSSMNPEATSRIKSSISLTGLPVLFERITASFPVRDSTCLLISSSISLVTLCFDTCLSTIMLVIPTSLPRVVTASVLPVPGSPIADTMTGSSVKSEEWINPASSARVNSVVVLEPCRPFRMLPTSCRRSITGETSSISLLNSSSYLSPPASSCSLTTLTKRTSD